MQTQKIKAAFCLFFCFLVSIVNASAQLSFIGGVIVGSILTGDNKSVLAGDGVTILYTLPGIAARVKNPLMVKQASIWVSFDTAPFEGKYQCKFSSRGKSVALYEIFKCAEGESEKFELLQVLRVNHPQNSNSATIWFVYLEKKAVAPMPPG
ncbi:MAG: hypothetical protein HY398_01540 [Candidatus Doudnabacteria bacterium]|nr:hypothetical protein [Candidatus Doudnabacteria bacterium]